MAVGKKSSIITPDQSIYLPSNEAQNIIFERQQRMGAEKQAAVEEYNKNLYNIDPRFESKTFTNGMVVVKLMKDDYLEINNESERNESGLIINAPVRKQSKMQVESQGGKLELIDNPVPYLMIGVVCAFDEDILEKAGGVMKENLKVGATVELFNLSLQDCIYYLDKKRADSPIERNELIAGVNPFPNYEGYVLVRPSDIECFIPKLEL